MFQTSVRDVLEPRNERKCAFHEVSACRDYVSRWVCNRHAALFGLVYEVSKYKDGNNESWSEIETFVCSDGKFVLPLFLDNQRTVLLNDIEAFCKNAASNYPEIKEMAMKNTICTLMGMNAYTTQCKIGGWLDDRSTRIYVTVDNANVMGWDTLPDLHKLLLHYTKPMKTFVGDNTTIFRVPMLELEKIVATIESYRFVVPSPQILLKHTGEPGSRATPIVLSAEYHVDKTDRTVMARRIADPRQCTAE